MRNARSFSMLFCVLFACQVPTEPEPEAEPAKRLPSSAILTLQLWAGSIKYAASMGGNEWRATFEVKVMLDSSKSIRKQTEIDFFWKASHKRPTADENGWISAGTATAAYPHGLMSIDGHWIDREERKSPPYWIRARIYCDFFDSAIELIGMCNFLESIEQPTETWDRSKDLNFDLGDRILAEKNLKTTAFLFNK